MGKRVHPESGVRDARAHERACAPPHHTIFCSWLLAWYGDKEIVNATYATDQRYLDYLLSQRDANGLLSYGLGDWIPVLSPLRPLTGFRRSFS